MLKLLDKIPPESFVLSGHQIETKKLFELFEVFLVPISPNLLYIYIYIYIYGWPSNFRVSCVPF
jgi:hypothetical protein